MSKMTLGSYTFAMNPSNMPLIHKVLSIAHLNTYSSVVTFSWGADYAGLIIPLKWDYMNDAQWNSIDAIYAVDQDVVFDPQDGTSKTYNVHIINPFDGEHFVDSNFHKNVVMTLLLKSEVT